MVVVLFFVSLITFGIFFLGQNNPARAILGTHTSPANLERVTKYYGFDKPVYVQYSRYMRHLLKGDLGSRTDAAVRHALHPGSASRRRSSSACTGIFFELLIGIPIGMMSALQAVQHPRPGLHRVQPAVPEPACVFWA